MLIESFPSDEDFFLRKFEHVGHELILVNPRPTFFDWTQNLLHFRSSIWTPQGELVSACFQKFFNYEEKPHIDPFDGDLLGCSCIEKLDGSALILSKYAGKLIIRTRGSTDIYAMGNYSEAERLLEDDSISELILEGTKLDTWPQSWIFEWESPTNQIVLRHPHPKLSLIGLVNHEDYSLAKQAALDDIAARYGFQRPRRFEFKSVSDLLVDVGRFENQEGICLYYNEDQNIRKIKSSWYLKLHAFRSTCSPRVITGLYLAGSYANQEEFEKYIETQFDFECVKLSKPFIDELYRYGVTPAVEWENRLRKFTADNSSLSQKDFALALFPFCGGDTALAAIGFELRKFNRCDKSRSKWINNQMEKRFELFNTGACVAV